MLMTVVSFISFSFQMFFLLSSGRDHVLWVQLFPGHLSGCPVWPGEHHFGAQTWVPSLHDPCEGIRSTDQILQSPRE